MADKTLGQIYHDEVEALKASGTSNADAVREVAKQHGKKENAVRGGIHQYRQKLAGGATSPSRRGRKVAPHSVDDYLLSAREAVQSALALLDHEVEDAKAELDAAQARYDAAVKDTEGRRDDLQRKLDALK